MPASVADFVKAAEDSGILTADSLAEFLQGVAPETDATALANRLVKAGRITAFQAKHIYGGKAGSLVLGPYVVVDLLGKGGMGYVYKAEHRRMRRVVALKVIAKAALKSPAAVLRFEREVHAAALLEHPNIVTAFDAGEAAGTHYLVMQFVDGRNLSEVVKELGPQPAGRAVDWVLQAARGLAYAHGKGVVHRDIKPGNLLVDQDGVVKILDMGLARLETLDVDQDQLTGTGQIMGTVDYMAPEQAMDTRQADARSDIYSLGVTLWYLLTGRPLFTGDTVMNKMMAHMHTAAPSLLTVRGEISPDLETIFQKMVAKKPADRFQSMQDVITAIQSLPQSDSGAGPPSIAFSRGGASLGPLGTGGTQTLQRHKSQQTEEADENTARLSAVDVDTDAGVKNIRRTLPRPTARKKQASVALVGGALGACVLIGLVMFALGGRRDVRPPRQDGKGEVVDDLIHLPPNTTPETWSFSTPNDLADFWIAGLAEIKPHVGVTLGNGKTDSSLSTKEVFASPLRVEYEVSAGPNRTYDIFPGIFVAPANTRSGIHYLFGDNGGTRDWVLIYGKYISLPHEPVSEGHVYSIVLEVDSRRQLTISRDSKLIYRGILPSTAPLRGSVQCGGGFGNVTYRRLTIGTMPEASDSDTVADKRLPGSIVEDSTGIKFVYMPGGSFRMGSPADEEGRFAGETLVDVSLTKPFLISQTEVTQSQWKQVMGSEPWKGRLFVKEGDNYPASHISWDLAITFCDRLTEREHVAGRVLDERYTLPTEAQWEYACRAGTHTAYSFGDDKSLLSDYAWWGAHECGGNSRGHEYGHEVATKKPNPWGIYDMHGNMWEWCLDFSAGDQNGGIDPKGPPYGKGHVLRGGGWPECQTFLRSANRSDGNPAAGNFGIRVVRVSESVHSAIKLQRNSVRASQVVESDAAISEGVVPQQAGHDPKPL